uniref:Uncharacterized protein n=1 Tax=Arundo donax TaxID=35708 RepID=A0A0A9HIY7_ARUDO
MLSRMFYETVVLSASLHHYHHICACDMSSQISSYNFSLDPIFFSISWSGNLYCTLCCVFSMIIFTPHYHFLKRKLLQFVHLSDYDYTSFCIIIHWIAGLKLI